MSQHPISLKDMTIASGQTVSTETLLASEDFSDADALGFFAPATLPETITVQVAPSESPASGDWKPLYRGGADVTIGAGKHITVDYLTFKALRLVADGATGDARVFNVVKIIWV